MAYEDNPTVHENQNYVVKVGLYPGDELESYLVINKEFGVVEYCHSILHFARSWADNYSSVLEDETPSAADIADLPDVE